MSAMWWEKKITSTASLGISLKSTSLQLSTAVSTLFVLSVWWDKFQVSYTVLAEPIRNFKQSGRNADADGKEQ